MKTKVNFVNICTYIKEKLCLNKYNLIPDLISLLNNILKYEASWNELTKTNLYIELIVLKNSNHLMMK